MSDSAPVVKSPHTTISAACPAERHLDLGDELAVAVAVAVALRGGKGDAERLATGNDRLVAHRIGARVSMPTKGVPFTRQVSFPLDISMCRNTENALLEGPCRVLATSRHLIAP
jgi:hypothetical protein